MKRRILLFISLSFLATIACAHDSWLTQKWHALANHAVTKIVLAPGVKIAAGSAVIAAAVFVGWKSRFKMKVPIAGLMPSFSGMQNFNEQVRSESIYLSAYTLITHGFMRRNEKGNRISENFTMSQLIKYPLLPLAGTIAVCVGVGSYLIAQGIGDSIKAIKHTEKK